MFFDVEIGLRRRGRTGLNKMLKKAAKGKINYIITKSIGRVSRDTLEVNKQTGNLQEYDEQLVRSLKITAFDDKLTVDLKY